MRRSLLAAALLLAACSRSTSPAPAPAGGVLASAPHYQLALAPCPTAPCAPTLVVTALAGFKVNEDYPTKWVPDAASAEAAPGPGTFTHPSKTVGELALPVKPGTARVTGTFKFSVCTDDECKLEAPQIAFDVPAR